MTTGCPFTDPERLFQDLAATRADGGLPYAEPFEARVVSRYDDIVQALHDPDTYSSRPSLVSSPASRCAVASGRSARRATVSQIRLQYGFRSHRGGQATLAAFWPPTSAQRCGLACAIL